MPCIFYFYYLYKYEFLFLRELVKCESKYLNVFLKKKIEQIKKLFV